MAPPSSVPLPLSLSLLVRVISDASLALFLRRHATYGFSWQAAGKDPSLSRAASERKTHSSVHELLDDTSEGFLTRMGSGSDSTRVRSRTHSDGGTDEGEDWGVEGDFRGSFGRSKKNRQGDRKVQFL